MYVRVPACVCACAHVHVFVRGVCVCVCVKYESNKYNSDTHECFTLSHVATFFN